MQSSISVVTLAVVDLERSVRFYQQGLGLPTNGIVGDADRDTQVAFFRLNDRLKLALWPVESLSRQLGSDVSGSGHMLSHNVDSAEAVDVLINDAALAGATILKPAHTQPWGCYGGYFSDPDGHCWEITFNPTSKKSTLSA